MQLKIGEKNVKKLKIFIDKKIFLVYNKLACAKILNTFSYITYIFMQKYLIKSYNFMYKRHTLRTT